MKKWKKAVCGVLTAAIVTGGGVFFYLNPPADTEEKYLEKINSMTIFENTPETAVPQTEIYNIVKSHFENELPEGKKVKKAIVIGYDGCRLDALENVGHYTPETSYLPGAMDYIISEGGKAYISYCGGVNYPEKNTQDTSTAPGWCSMLTGHWADKHGIRENYVVKSNDYPTLLTTLVENKTIESSAFCVSWKGHFSKKNATYNDEVQYTKDNNLNVSFVCSANDAGTRETVLSDIKSENCTDFIFTILEYCDHSGHRTGFYTEKRTYKNAFSKADSAALEMISAIKNRETYDEEDWLILLTTDHGGKGRDHGGASIQERYTFIFKLES